MLGYDLDSWGEGQTLRIVWETNVLEKARRAEPYSGCREFSFPELLFKVGRGTLINCLGGQDTPVDMFGWPPYCLPLPAHLVWRANLGLELDSHTGCVRIK
jgi:hypothetical protein